MIYFRMTGQNRSRRCVKRNQVVSPNGFSDDQRGAAVERRGWNLIENKDLKGLKKICPIKSTESIGINIFAL